MAKADSAEQAAPGKKNRLKLILIVVVGLILAIGASVGGTWFFLNKDRPEGEQPAVQQAAAPVVRQPAIYEELAPPFIVNFQAAGRNRYLQVSVALLGRDPQQMATLKVHTPTLRNQLVMLFSSQDFAELNTPLGLEVLKQKVTATVQELAMRETGAPVVEQVLFTNFVMQ